MIVPLLLLIPSVVAAAVIPGRQSLKITKGQIVDFDPRGYLDMPADCGLRVATDSIDDKIGVLRPRSSTCGRNLTYSHFGSTSGQTLRLFILYGEKVERAFIRVEIVGAPLYSLGPLLIGGPGGTATLQENIESGRRDCLALVTKIPKFGALHLRHPGQLQYPCNHLKGALIYKHFQNAKSNDTFTMRVTLQHPKQMFYIQVNVYVKENRTNLPPIVSGRHSIWSLKSKDDWTDSKLIYYKIENLPKDLTILSTFTGRPLDGFHQGDVDRRSVRLSSDVSVNSTVRLKVFDDGGSHSDVNVSVEILDGRRVKRYDKASSGGLTVREGGSSPLSHFIWSDEYKGDRFRIIDGPRYGNISLIGLKGDCFTLADIIEGRIVYQNTESSSDDFILIEIESAGTIVYPIFIISSDSQSPVLKGPKDLMVKDGEASITSFKASDVDSFEDELGYELVGIKYGKIVIRDDKGIETDVEEWRASDVLEGRVYYKLVKRPVGGGIDQLSFHLIDSAQPPNQSPIYTIPVYIGRDTIAPRMTSNGGLLYKGNPTQIKGLEYTDQWPSSNIVYTPTSNHGVFVTKDGSPLPIFSQEMIDNGVVHFKMTSSSYMTNFEIPFSVCDGDGNTIKNQDQFVGVLQLEEGGSVELTEEVLDIQEEPNLEFTLEEIPKRGQLLIIDVPAKRFNSSSIFLGDVYYEHSAEEIGLTKIFDKFSLRVVNSTKLHRVTVVINPVDDFLPLIEPRESIYVKEGSSIKLTTNHLSIVDEDTQDKDVICDVIVQPSLGSIKSFTKLDLIEGKVFYHQNVHEKLEPTQDSFTLSCHDTNILRKNRIIMTVSILPVNDEPPTISVKNITSKFMQLSDIVTVGDLDTPSHLLTVGILKQPRKGLIEKKFGNFLNFTVSELPEVYYENLGGSDSFVIGVSDGDFLVAAEIWITVEEGFLPLLINRGIEVEIDNSVVLTDKELYSEIEGLSSDRLIYCLRNSPMFGALLYQGTELGPGDKFSQNDISKNRISYTHTDSTSLMDVFVVDITDGSHVLQNQNIFITILGQNMTFRVESKTSVIYPKASLILNGELLSVTPKPKEKSKVEFHVMSETKQGRLEFRDNQGVDIQSFTYVDLESERVQYLHTTYSPSQEIIQFEVTDGKFQVFHSLTIVVQSRNVQSLESPKVKLTTNRPLTGLALNEGRLAAVITKNVLLAEDSAGNAIAYKITQRPTYGEIFNRKLNSTVTTFTQDDINNELIVYYLNEGIKVSSDTIVMDLIGQNSKFKDIQFLIEWSWVSFKSNLFVTEENNDSFEIELVRKGSLTESASLEISVEGGNATAEDYILHDTKVHFSPGQSYIKKLVRLENDNIYEGIEFFVVAIKHAENTVVDNPGKAMIIIADSSNDISDTTTFQDEEDYSENPQVIDKRTINKPLLCSNGNSTGFQFSKEIYYVNEAEPEINVEIVRSGDMMSTSSLICFTEENTATLEDFKPRRKGTHSEIIFLPGDIRKNCSIAIKNDDQFEGNEDFTVHLSCTNHSKIGRKSSVNVVIKDEDDEEVVLFEKEHYFVREPKRTLKKSNDIIQIPVLRKGDISYGRHVKVFTEDGTAKEGIDFIAKQTVLSFEPKKRESTYEIEILNDKITEGREFFTVKLEMLGAGRSKRVHQAIVYISDAPNAGAVMFPGPPVVISLRDYGRSQEAVKHPVQGYPVICVSVCDGQHKSYIKFQEWCLNYNITINSSLYFWQIEDLNGDLKEIQAQLYFAKTNQMILDSVYFRGGYRLRCGVRPVIDGTKGKMSHSAIVAIDIREGICPSAKENMLGAEPFMSHIAYSDLNGTRGLKLSISVPHYDGLFPLVSTHQLTSTKEILSSYPMRAEIHKCSNILKASEIITKESFLNPEANTTPDFEPYQYNKFRGEDTVRLYKHLNLKSCMWRFEAYYTLAEVVNICGASVKSESSSENDEASVLLELPLHVYYFTISLLGWQQIHSSTTMKLKFTYKTSTIIKGDMMEIDHEKPDGHISATNMFISPNGSLIVYFKTKPKFIGYFMPEVPGRFLSKVTNEDRPELLFSLSLLGNITEGPRIEQSWMFSSDIASVDYSGNYEITLIPCVAPTVEMSCIPTEPVVQNLEIQFQQISDPILHKYTLDTEFKLKKRRDAGNEEDTSIFERGDYVFGQIAMVPPQDHLSLNIRKCYVCSGKNGHVPRYDPGNKEFGCLMDSPDLYYTLKLIDKDDTGSVQKTFFNQLFNASLTQNNCELNDFGDDKTKNCDAFLFDSTPLFNQPLSKIWYVHCTYSITITKRDRMKRHTELDVVRSGTNIHQIILKNPSMEHPTYALNKVKQVPHKDVQVWYVVSFIAVLTLSLIVSAILFSFLMNIKKELKQTNNKYSYVSYNNCRASEAHL